MTSLTELRAEAGGCRACPLWKTGTQTVFGEGAARASVMLVGEQPGDQEDKAGRPFVGPAGRVLDEALEAAGIDRGSAYVTNAVKHFKWEARGKRRIHAKPSWSEVAACRPWLDAELEAVRPRVLVCLGATAAQALLGKSFRVTKMRGQILPSELAEAIIKAHAEAIQRFYTDKAFAVQAYLAFDKQPEADVNRIYDIYSKGQIFDRVPYVLAPAVKSIVTQQVDPRLAADLKAFDYKRVIDNSTVDRLVKEGFFEQLFGATVKTEEQQRAKIAFGK